jgi:hypothetical protein
LTIIFGLPILAIIFGLPILTIIVFLHLHLWSSCS